MRKKSFAAVALLAIAAGALFTACSGGDDEDVVTVYVGRSQALVGPLLDQFSKETGIKIRVRYGDGTDLALGILEEGENSAVDVYYGQDVGTLGALKSEGLLAELSEETLEQVEPAFRSPDGLWVGVSGRARVMVYNTDNINPDALPESYAGYVDPQWKGKVGIVPRSETDQIFGAMNDPTVLSTLNVPTEFRVRAPKP